MLLKIGVLVVYLFSYLSQLPARQHPSGGRRADSSHHHVGFSYHPLSVYVVFHANCVSVWWHFESNAGTCRAIGCVVLYLESRYWRRSYCHALELLFVVFLLLLNVTLLLFILYLSAVYLNGRFSAARHYNYRRDVFQNQGKIKLVAVVFLYCTWLVVEVVKSTRLFRTTEEKFMWLI